MQEYWKISYLNNIRGGMNYSQNRKKKVFQINRSEKIISRLHE